METQGRQSRQSEREGKQNNKVRQTMGHITESQRQNRNLQSGGDKGGLCRTIKRELDESGGGLESEGRVGGDDGTIE